MATTLKEEHVKTTQPVDKNKPRMPHERDESHDSQTSGPRDDMKQAYDDIQHGLVDTDLRGQRGVEEVVDKTPEKIPGKASRKTPSKTPGKR